MIRRSQQIKRVVEKTPPIEPCVNGRRESRRGDNDGQVREQQVEALTRYRFDNP